MLGRGCGECAAAGRTVRTDLHHLARIVLGVAVAKAKLARDVFVTILLGATVVNSDAANEDDGKRWSRTASTAHLENEDARFVDLDGKGTGALVVL